MITGKYRNQLYAVLRIMAGFLFLWHGAQKLFGFPPLPQGIVLPWHLSWIAGPIEFIGGFLITIGLWTHYATFLASGEMAYAYWTVHARGALLPMVNKGEVAVLYCFIFLYLSAVGSGFWSIDNLINSKKGSKETQE
jgi:putative oxidoreductase